MPDLSAFCNGNVYEYQVTEDTDNTEYVYFWYYNGKAQAEYIELLEDYNFVLRASSEDDGNDKYAFDYVGDDGDVAVFDSKQGGKKFKQSTTDISLFIWSLHYGNGESEIHISFADGVTYADTGDRTTRELTPYDGDDAAASSSGSSAVVSGDSDGNRGVLDCLTCGGSGDCKKCNGYGFTYTYTYVDGVRTEIKKGCSSCHGSMKCSTCGGSGKR